MAPRALPRFAATMGPSDSPHAHARRLLIPTGVSQLPAGVRGLSVPGLIVRHAPFPLTPESQTTALTRCFIVRAGFVLSDGLATPISVTRLIWLRFRYGSRLRGLKCFAGHRYRRPRPSRYMSNGRLHGGLLSFHEIKPVSLTHQRSQSAPRKTMRTAFKPLCISFLWALCALCG